MSRTVLPFEEKLRKKPFVPLSWRPTLVRYEPTDQQVSLAAGLGPIVDLFYEDPLYLEFKKCLPLRKSNASYPSDVFAMTAVCSVVFGHDCIEDVLEFQQDPLVRQKLGGEIPKPRAMGDYYRDFSQKNRDDLNEFLRVFARRARAQVAPNVPLVIDMDSTAHVQRGLKMEGVEWNYQSKWCLDSLAAWDELGFCHGMELRNGNTFSSQGAPELIAKVFSHLKHKDEKYFRADSAFHNKKVILSCVAKGARFTITAHRNSTWEDQVKAGAITHWTPWEYSPEEIKKARELGVELPKVEVGSMLYKPGWSPQLRFYIVVKRTWTKDKKGNWYWKNYGIVTNWDLFRNRAQNVVLFHNKRGNSENYIKEEKWNFDLLHFPMKKLHANHAFGLLTMVAHNILRTVALLDNRTHPLFAKKLRRKLIYIPGRLVHRSSRYVMRIPDPYWKEVQRMTTAWAATRESALARAG